jgi:hypothetical protein
MKLTVNISTYCDGAFLGTGQLLMAIVVFQICLPRVAHLTRPARPLVPGNALLETDLDHSRTENTLLASSEICKTHVPSRKASVRRLQPIAYSSSSSQSIHQELVWMQAQLQGITSTAPALCQHLPYWYPWRPCSGVALTVAGVDGGELENDDNAVRCFQIRLLSM